MTANPANDRPLTGMANFMLLAGATATMLLFYFFVIVSILVLLAIFAVEMVLLVGAMRFGAAGIILPLIKSHGNLLLIFFRSMKLGKPVEFRIELGKDENPDLAATLQEICRKAGVPLPQKIYLEMGVNAWVQMKGFRRGSGATGLGMGYDLLAGLTRIEFEGVLAHEMMHARLVERGLRRLLNGGIGRAGKLTDSLGAQLTEARRVNRSERLAEMFRWGADAMTRLAARQVAACSRQDEFAADRGAAEITSAGAIRSSLLKLEDLNRLASRVGFRDRVAQLESGEGFGEWLIRELAAVPPQTQREARAAVFNKYSTHPSLQDRLAALANYPDQALADSPPALGLLAHPDDVAEKLVSVIQKQAVAQEEKDSRNLTRWSRKSSRSLELQPKQYWGVGVIVLGLILGCCAAAFSGLLGLLVMTLSLVGGIVLIRLWRYRESILLPVPEYALIKAASQKKLEINQDEIRRMEEEMRQSIQAGRKRRDKELLLVRRSYEALETCDYVRAHVAARLCLDLNNKSIPGALAFAVAAGFLKQGAQTMQALSFVMRKTGMKGESQPWGAGWGLLLLGDWAQAEAFLEQARTRKPASATVLALLAQSQVRRGKLFSAIAGARKAALMRPDEKEYGKLLVDLLLEAGFLREAGEQLTRLQNEAVTDPELMISMVKLGLMAKNIPVADQWAELAVQSSAGPHKFVELGNTYETVRLDERAGEFFRHALTLGHYPEALIGLGRLEIHRRNFEQARSHLLSALNLKVPVGEGSANPLELVLPTFRQLSLLEDPVLDCRGWVAAMSPSMVPAALANVTLLVYAPTLPEAQAYFKAVVSAMQPDPAPSSEAIVWKAASREHQPDGPVAPGIQGILN